MSATDLPALELGFARTPLRQRLVDAALRGEKTATAGLLVQHESLPVVGERCLLLGFDDEPLAIVETTEVRVLRVADVDLEFARDEGEGFQSVAEWRAAHEEFWTGMAVDDDTLVVAERFTVVERF